jgi:hypothetical protein
MPNPDLPSLTHLPTLVTTIGGLGTAAFGLVDAFKVFGNLGPNRIGFSGIRKAVEPLIPEAANGLRPAQILETLRSNWFNGTDLASQKSIAKSLIKLNLDPGNAAAVAQATGVDATVLIDVVKSIAAAQALTTAQSDFFARFDLTVTAMLDDAYQHADQVYRNGTRALATLVAVVLAFVGGHMIAGENWGLTLLVGLLATPIAPVAKDLSSALATAVNVFQAAKK